MFAVAGPRVPEDATNPPLFTTSDRKDVVMFAAFGIVLLVVGAIVTFAADVSTKGVDIVATGWILMAGGGLALLISMIDRAGWRPT